MFSIYLKTATTTNSETIENCEFRIRSEKFRNFQNSSEIFKNSSEIFKNSSEKFRNFQLHVKYFAIMNFQVPFLPINLTKFKNSFKKSL